MLLYVKELILLRRMSGKLNWEQILTVVRMVLSLGKKA